MARYIDPLYVAGWLLCLLLLIFGALTWIVLALVRKKPSGWPTRRQAIAVVVAPVLWALISYGWIKTYTFGWASPQLAYAPDTVIRLDTNGRPLLDHGKPIKVSGDPKVPGAYRVYLRDARYFDLYLPASYTGNEPLPCGFFLHGDNEAHPEKFAGEYTELASKANSQGMIAVFPVSQTTYTLWGIPQHRWNDIDSLSGRDERFPHDTGYAWEVRDWVLSHLNFDQNKTGLAGLSGGAVFAASIACSGLAPTNWFFSCGGTMFDWQLQRRPYYPPTNVFIQLNELDTTTLPLETADGQVTKGSEYYLAVYGAGFANIAHSRPTLQIKYWLGYFNAQGGIDNPTNYEDPDGQWRSVVHAFRMGNGATRYFVEFWVKGEHAWHGTAGGGSPEEGIKPNMAVPMSDIVVALTLGKSVSQVMAALTAKQPLLK